MAAVPTAESAKGELLAETIRLHGRGRLRVQGTSMLPSLWPGDLIEVARRSPAEIEAGAIILYARDQRLFAHRVLKKEAREDDYLLVARGDRLSRPDPPVWSEELLARGLTKSVNRDRDLRRLRFACKKQGASDCSDAP